jgi:hypothetical protein
LSYSEENGQVVLTMSREDYTDVDYALLIAIDRCRSAARANRWRELRDRLNSGNPNYTPYQTGEKKS